LKTRQEEIFLNQFKAWVDWNEELNKNKEIKSLNEKYDLAVGVFVEDRVILEKKYKCEINNNMREFENDGLIGTG